MLKRWIRVFLILFPGLTFGQSAASKYIELYKEEAVKKMNQYGVPASIILGVAMHESGSGTSKISKYLNNHFGMKGKNNSKQINSSYKGYDSVGQSYDDFIMLLKKRTSFNKLFEKYTDHDYTGWAKGIQKGGYAHSRTWSSQVVAIINKYKLYELDNRPPSIADLPIAPVPSMTTETPLPIEVAEAPKKAAVTVYRVKKGDNLGLIAKKFGTSVKTIRTKNGLRSTNLQIGQRLEL